MRGSDRRRPAGCSADPMPAGNRCTSRRCRSRRGSCPCRAARSRAVVRHRPRGSAWPLAPRCSSTRTRVGSLLRRRPHPRSPRRRRRRRRTASAGSAGGTTPSERAVRVRVDQLVRCRAGPTSPGRGTVEACSPARSFAHRPSRRGRSRMAGRPCADAGGIPYSQKMPRCGRRGRRIGIGPGGDEGRARRGYSARSVHVSDAGLRPPRGTFGPRVEADRGRAGARRRRRTPAPPGWTGLTASSSTSGIVRLARHDGEREPGLLALQDERHREDRVREQDHDDDAQGRDRHGAQRRVDHGAHAQGDAHEDQRPRRPRTAGCPTASVADGRYRSVPSCPSGAAVGRGRVGRNGHGRPMVRPPGAWVLTPLGRAHTFAKPVC